MFAEKSQLYSVQQIVAEHKYVPGNVLGMRWRWAWRKEPRINAPRTGEAWGGAPLTGRKPFMSKTGKERGWGGQDTKNPGVTGKGGEQGQR